MVSTIRRRIAVVDDKIDIRLLLRTRLSLVPQLEVVGEAGNGREAVDLARRLQPEAMILDLEMPVMSGGEAIPLLRQAQPSMRILVYSAQGDRFQLTGSSRPDAALVKGVDLKLLVDILLGLLRERPATPGQLPPYGGESSSR